MIDPTVFIVIRFLLFFPFTFVAYRSMQALDLQKVFKANSGDAIRLLLMMISVIIGFFFMHAFVSLLEYISALFA
jgi:uncharacterized membrane protein YwzB